MISELGFDLLLVVFAFSVVGFSSTLLFLLLYRRKLRPTAAAEDGSESTVGMRLPSKDLVFRCLLCWRARSRVEPAVSGDAAAKPPEEEEEEWDLERWRAACMGPSRELYTIKEEEEEDTEEMLFSTPCSSPAYFTPMSSPMRAAAGRGRGRTGGGCLVCRGV